MTTRCSATQLCGHPSWQITHGPTRFDSASAQRSVSCYTCGGSWTEEITHGEAVRDGEEPPFAMAPDVEQEDA